MKDHPTAPTGIVSVIRHRKLAPWLVAATFAVGSAGSTLVACSSDAEFYDRDRARNEVEQPCYAHSGPEPAELLDWRVKYSSAIDSSYDYSQGGPQIQGHPEVSCEVGVGILAGWWQWHTMSSHDCAYLAVETADGAGPADDSDWSRLNPIEPILLSEGDVVVGYQTVGQDASRLIGATSHPECFLEYIDPEDQPSA